MNNIKQQEPVSSSELTEALIAERQAEAKEIAQSLASKKAASEPAAAKPLTSLPGIPATRGSMVLMELAAFLKQTKQVWLIVAMAIFGLMAIVTGVNRASEWARKARERRHEQAIATVTPERLLARCGQPAGDVTKDVYPIVLRTMTYQTGENEALVFSFSRTAEEKSDWVFLSMKDASGGKSYDTPEAKVAAMSCLDSKK